MLRLLLITVHPEGNFSDHLPRFPETSFLMGGTHLNNIQATLELEKIFLALSSERNT